MHCKTCDINPILLARKFQEAHGVALADYTPPAKVDPAVVREAQLNAALKVVRAEAAHYLMTASGAALVGKLFTYNGEEFAFVFYRAHRPKWAISAVRVRDAQLMKFTAPCWTKIGPQITSTI